MRKLSFRKLMPTLMALALAAGIVSAQDDELDTNFHMGDSQKIIYGAKNLAGNISEYEPGEAALRDLAEELINSNKIIQDAGFGQSKIAIYGTIVDGNDIQRDAGLILNGGETEAPEIFVVERGGIYYSAGFPSNGEPLVLINNEGGKNPGREDELNGFKPDKITVSVSSDIPLDGRPSLLQGLSSDREYECRVKTSITIGEGGKGTVDEEIEIGYENEPDGRVVALGRKIINFGSKRKPIETISEGVYVAEGPEGFSSEDPRYGAKLISEEFNVFAEVCGFDPLSMIVEEQIRAESESLGESGETGSLK